MKIFGKDFLFNNKKVYHEENKPVANDILFNDGQNFQQKLDNGSLKGPQGIKGDTGNQGPKGETGPQGPTGAKGTDGFTWRPSINSSGDLTWSKNSSTLTPDSSNIKGPIGPVGQKGADGLTTSITVNGQRYNHSGGNITLPNFLKEDGGNINGSINSSLATGTYLNGNKGIAVINSTNKSGSYTTLIKSNSTNGVFTLNTYNNNFLLSYTDKGTIDSNANEITKSATLLNEHGNALFPGYVKASSFYGKLTGTEEEPITFEDNGTNVGYIEDFGIILGTDRKKTFISSGYKTFDIYRKCDSSLPNYDHTVVRYGLINADGGVAAIEAKLRSTTGDIQTAYLRLDANAGRVYTDGYFQCAEKWLKIGGRWLTIDTKAPSGAKGDIWIQCF